MKKSYKTVTSLFRSTPKQVGLPPGSLVHVGEQKVEQSVITLIDYDAEQLTVETDVSLQRCLELKDSPTVSWINLDGIHDIAQFEAFGKAFDIHPLALEDMLNTGHRPKVENFDHFMLIILKMLHYDDQTHQIRAEQISLILTRNNLLSFQECPGDVFAGVRDRLTRKYGRIRQRGPDYLAYALIDSIVDHYFHILEQIGDRLENLERELIDQPSIEILQQLHQLKGQLILLRKSVWPMRELANSLLHDEWSLIETTTRIYLRDLYDHSIQALDTLETFRDTTNGLVDLYMSNTSLRMNEVMQLLTIIGSIFIPLTFLAGVYGMNFEFMPELKWRYGYPLVWGLMISILIGMIWFFKRKKWF